MSYRSFEQDTRPEEDFPSPGFRMSAEISSLTLFLVECQSSPAGVQAMLLSEEDNVHCFRFLQAIQLISLQGNDNAVHSVLTGILSFLCHFFQNRHAQTVLRLIKRIVGFAGTVQVDSGGSVCFSITCRIALTARSEYNSGNRDKGA